MTWSSEDPSTCGKSQNTAAPPNSLISEKKLWKKMKNNLNEPPGGLNIIINYVGIKHYFFTHVRSIDNYQVFHVSQSMKR